MAQMIGYPGFTNNPYFGSPGFNAAMGPSLMPGPNAMGQYGGPVDGLDQNSRMLSQLQMMEQMLELMTMMMGAGGSMGNQMGMPGMCNGMPGGYFPGMGQSNPAMGFSPVECSAPSAPGPMAAGGHYPPSNFGNKLARDARRIAQSGVAGCGKNCKRGVRLALNKQGIQLNGLSAYMAAGQLAKNPNFQEIKGLKRADLRELPPGATVVWNRAPKHPDGHISIAMGDGREASDVMRNQITNYPSSYRVFLPRAN